MIYCIYKEAVTFQITVFCIIFGAKISRRADNSLDFYRKMYYNYIIARFYTDICTNDIYSIIQTSVKVNRR